MGNSNSFWFTIDLSDSSNLNDIIVIYISESHKSASDEKRLAKHIQDVQEVKKLKSVNVVNNMNLVKTLNYLAKHIQTVNEGKKPFTCEFC